MVQADILAELDRIWLTATLATNVNLEILLHLTALFECDTHQLANACESMTWKESFLKMSPSMYCLTKES